MSVNSIVKERRVDDSELSNSRQKKIGAGPSIDALTEGERNGWTHWSLRLDGSRHRGDPRGQEGFPQRSCSWEQHLQRYSGGKGFLEHDLVSPQASPGEADDEGFIGAPFVGDLGALERDSGVSFVDGAGKAGGLWSWGQTGFG